MLHRTKRTVGLSTAALLAIGMFAAPAAAEDHDEVAVNTTFICQAPEDCIALAFGGVEDHEVQVEAGDYIWRVGDERDTADWSDGIESVGYDFFIDATVFADGDIGPGEAQFQVHSTGGAASVDVEEGYTNLRGGTATSGDTPCEMVEVEPEPEPQPKGECKAGGWEDLELRNQGLCIASVQADENAEPHAHPGA
ncbi:MAG: hypothetical protein EA387_16730 [Nitriliruptor sp.]|nr:MAG: hypothetical protein EA387_16730 [Nitriliruptor sp.]